uniref:protein MIGRI n=1 Tax=Snodgrassella alvi TaxID=1196083 RepID=UPI003F8D3851
MIGRLLRLLIIVLFLVVIYRCVLRKRNRESINYWVNSLAMILLSMAALICLLYVLKGD